MIAAIQYGGLPPPWVNVLEAAAEWGTPPWNIAGGARATWFLRWQEFGRLKSEHQKRETERVKRG